MLFFDIRKILYLKNHNQILDVDMQMCITLSKWLCYDPKNLKSVRDCLDYMFYVDVSTFYSLLYFNVPKATRVPYFKKIEKNKKKEDKLEEKLKYILGWSSSELEKSRVLIDKVIYSNTDYWKKELGVK